MRSLKFAACIVIGLFLLAGCKSDGDDADSGNGQPVPAKSLYERLGGKEAITLVVDDFVQRAMANESVNFTRQGTSAAWDPTPANLMKLKASLVAYVSSITGGPVKYLGKDMAAAHAGMKITDKEFFTAAADLEASLIKFEVPQVERAELLQLVAATRGDVVGK